MTAKTTFKCLHCNESHRADPRNRGRQKYCSKPGCRKASKAASQARWLARGENHDYFRGAHHCERVKRWRQANPGYWRRPRKRAQAALQDSSNPQTTDNELVVPNVPDVVQDALQDLWVAQFPLLMGLVVHLTGEPLQESIVGTARMLVNRGEDILRRARGSPPPTTTPHHHERQASPLPAPAAARPPPV